MYQFRPISERMQEMDKMVRKRIIREDSERAMIVTESYKKNAHVTPIIKRVMATYDVVAKKTYRVEDTDVLVANKGKYYQSSVEYPEWGGPSWVAACTLPGGPWKMGDDGFYHNPPEEDLNLIISQDDADNLNSIAEYWKDNFISLTADAWEPDGAADFEKLNCCDYTPGSPKMFIPIGHLVAGYGKIIDVGYAAIRKQAQDFIDAHEGNIMGEDMNKYMFYKSAVIACDAGILHCKNYSKACSDKAAETTDPVRKAELLKMADGLMWISENPARNFWEAMQAALCYQFLQHADNSYPSPAIGRVDQYCGKFLKKELEEGTITLDQAQELVDCFFLKLNLCCGCAPAWITLMTGTGNTWQHTTIGGVDPETGEDATNPMTYMVLESLSRLALHDPTISLRFNKNSPDKLWECAIETSKHVGGLPLLQNDEVIIPALQKELGFSLKDARNFAIIGCQEIVGSGCDYPAPNGIHPPHCSVHHSVVLDMALNDGCNPFNGEQSKCHTGFLYDMKSMDEVMAAIKKMEHWVMHWFATLNNYTEYISMQLVHHAVLSISIDDCMEKGLDCNAGGARYNSYGGTATGLATIADSLATIEYMCFDKKKISTRELYDAYMANWEGYETLQQQILAEVPHYGNADPYADKYMKWICDTYYEVCRDIHSVRAKTYKCGLYGAADHVAQGYTAWATPDGRKTGQPIADATSPAQSRDKNGPTAVFQSTLAFDHGHYMDGVALNMRIHPSALSRDDGIKKLADMTKTYFAGGGLETQFNVVSADTMRKAQADPDSYKDLVVRIAGYSAYFVELNHDCQNDVISRTENVF